MWEAFVRFRVSDGNDETEVDLGIDYRALDRLVLADLGIHPTSNYTEAP